MRSFHTLFSVFALSSLVAGHMATPHKRAIDTCANIDLSLNVLNVLDVGVRVCACLGTTDALIKENSSLYVASKVLGEAGVKSKLVAAIHNGQGKSTCTYPDYGIPACSSKDLCNFNCPQGRIKVNGQCVCMPGTHDCNGKCVATYQACSSQPPKSSYGDYSNYRSVHQIEGDRNKRSGRGTPNWARRSLSSAHCPDGTEMCGVLGRPDAWECLKVEEDLESCGGCAYPFFPSQEPGVDCSSIPGAEIVACRKGLCEVSKCVTNWTISADGHACEPNAHAKNKQFISVGRATKQKSDVDSVRTPAW
ncbi:Dihydroxyacetone synthase [Ceratobasidium sp. 423]|nr:Dihydroxyacetone synthase [Ceratobasidium sp. 423]